MQSPHCMNATQHTHIHVEILYAWEADSCVGVRTNACKHKQQLDIGVDSDQAHSRVDISRCQLRSYEQNCSQRPAAASPCLALELAVAV